MQGLITTSTMSVMLISIQSMTQVTSLVIQLGLSSYFFGGV